MGSNRIAMQKIRAEKEFIVRWSGILTNGQPDSLEGRDLSLYLINPYGAESRQEMAVEGNTVTIRVYADTCKAHGQYRLKLYENKGKVGQTVLDQCEGFCIVATTCQEGGITQGLDLDIIELSGGDMAIGIQGRSAYEIAVANGFEGTEAEWLASLKGEKGDIGPQGPEGEKGDKGDKGDIGEAFTYSDFTPEQIAELQRPASEAAQLANQAASKANAAAESATRAAQTATQTETAIKQAEALRVTAEKQRETNESEREQAETSRKQAESGRATAEQGRVSAESGRATAEQQRVTEFATLKQESETATTEATKAADEANKAAQSVQGITDRLSETYPNFAAIEASGETNPNKIYIDAEKQTSYIYLNGEYVSVGGGGTGEDAYIYPPVNPYNVINQNTRTAVSVEPFYFQGLPVVSSAIYSLSDYSNKFYGFGELLALSLDGQRGNDYIGYYINSYNLIYLHKEDGIEVENITLGDIRNTANINQYKQLYIIVDLFACFAAIYGWKQSTGIVEVDKRAIQPTNGKFNTSYILNNVGFYKDYTIQKYLLTNGYIDINTLLGKQFAVGNYSEGESYGYRSVYKDLISNNVGIGGISSSKVKYELQEGTHIIASITGANNEYCSFKVTGNFPSGNIANASVLVRFKILEGSCQISAGYAGTPYILQNDGTLTLSSNVTLEIGKEYYLIIMNASSFLGFSYVSDYSTKMTGTFKIEVLDAKMCLIHEQICCAERLKGDVFMGNIPMLTDGSSAIYATPLITTGAKQNILGQQRVDASGNVYITIVDSEGNYVEKKTTP